MDATVEALETITQFLPQEGTTSFLACTMTETDQAIKKAMTCLNDYCQTSYRGAEILGVHLEGPFMAEKYVGAQRANAISRLTSTYFQIGKNCQETGSKWLPSPQNSKTAWRLQSTYT
ncbi:MAG: N-acetylglucosamine-6-phosphate deacetylase [Gammaproteobacteria bacterium]|jgi:N-acetylglucosamine-6-phosphate deacetylase|nr:N-acetylglucosamine-6-phosphate deacetylase [Gammaproteobacteria bacterium]